MSVANKSKSRPQKSILLVKKQLKPVDEELGS